MGKYLNPGKASFQNVLNGEFYIDKSGLIQYTNKVLSTPSRFICNSRPRRFGKSITADMLTAYYSKGGDAEELFSKLNISKEESFKKYLNAFDVIHIDIQWMLSQVDDPNEIVSYINKEVLEELKQEYPDVKWDGITKISGALSQIYDLTNQQFVFIIDEWDALVRMAPANKEVEEEYIHFLRGLFKGSEPSKYIALAYLTGILPIIKDKTQSALNHFNEFTMLSAGVLSEYVGFTEEEVKKLCDDNGRDFNAVKRWYDGYQLKDYHVYNPRAVVSVMESGEFQSYWSSTSTYESIRPYISMNFDGLKENIIEMLSGNEVNVNTRTYQNDMVSFENKDQIITMLIHLGYLAYHQEEGTAYIPNEEIRFEFMDAVNDSRWNEFIAFEKESKTLLEATLNLDGDAVSNQIERIHNQYTSMIEYNDENALSSVLTIGFLASMEYYFRPVRELPTGRGFADFVYIPKPRYINDYPALVVELKWNQDSITALQQIKEKNYPDSIQQYTGDVLLVGINYNKKTKKHSCVIEKLVLK